MAAPLNQRTHSLVTPPTYKFIHSLTCLYVNMCSYPLVHLSTRPLVHLSTRPLVHSLTCQLVSLLTRLLVFLSTCSLVGLSSCQLVNLFTRPPCLVRKQKGTCRFVAYPSFVVCKALCFMLQQEPRWPPGQVLRLLPRQRFLLQR